ncbi:MAG: hypothetical protein AAFU65_01600 [Pseudomonadota bacterium]
MSILARFFALALLIGGVVGMLFVLLALPAMLSRSLGGALFSLLFALPNAWAAWVGLELFRDTAIGWRLSPWCYALQVPVLITPPLVYLWFTGATVAVHAGRDPTGDLIMNAAPGIGANLQVAVGGGGAAFSVGANLFALVAFVVLMRQRGRRATSS